MNQLDNIIGTEGFKISVGIDMVSALLLTGGIFIAVVLGVVLSHIIIKSLNA